MIVALSCYCGGDYDWWYYPPQDFSTLTTKRGRRCCSCKKWTRPGATVGRFECWRIPDNVIEERIHGDEVPMRDRYMCEECAGLYFSLDDLGYCYTLGDNVRELVREYARLQAYRAEGER